MMTEFDEGDVVAKIGSSRKWTIIKFSFEFVWLSSLDNGTITWLSHETVVSDFVKLGNVDLEDW